MEINYSKQILRIHTPLNTSEYYIVKMLQVCKQFRLHTVESYKNADIYDNLPKSLSSHKNDMPKVLHYKNLYYNCIAILNLIREFISNST